MSFVTSQCSSIFIFSYSSINHIRTYIYVGQYGGHYKSYETADFLFSESITTEDTGLIYETSAVFRPEWITAVIGLGAKGMKSPAILPIGKYLLLPKHYTTTTSSSSSTIAATGEHCIKSNPPSANTKSITANHNSSLAATRQIVKPFKSRPGYSKGRHRTDLTVRTKKPKPSSTSSTNHFATVEFQTSEQHLRGTFVYHCVFVFIDARLSCRARIHGNPFCLPVGIPHIDNIGVVRERLVDAIPDYNGLVVTRIS